MTRTGTLAATFLAGALTLHGGATDGSGSQPLRSAAPKSVGTCDQFGPDYHHVNGSDTCIRVGGQVRFETGINIGGGGRR